MRSAYLGMVRAGNSGFLGTVPANTKVFLRGKTMREKQILARAVVMQKENGGNHAFFRGN